MALSGSEAAKAIQPGSTEFGDRATLEAGLQDVLGGAQGGAPSPTPSGGSLAIPEDPIGALASGQVAGDPNSPITDGLAVGPGTTPLPTDHMQGDRAVRLRQLALQASSPQVRAAARNELRRMTREPI